MTITPEQQAEIDRRMAVFERLSESGFFDIRGGRAVCHFDGDGQLRRVEREDVILSDDRRR